MLSSRSATVLKLLVERYIREGQAVGSKVLSQDPILSLSSASIRNVLAELESHGLVTSPHTSSGRVPTVQGLRYFVDSLLTLSTISPQELKKQGGLFASELPTQTLITSTSDMLSELTQWVGVVTVPHAKQIILRHVEFLPLSENRVLAVLVVNEREVQNRILVTKKIHTASELQQAGNFLTQHFVGRDLTTARVELLGALSEDRRQVDRLMKTVIEVADQAFQVEQQDDYVVTGQTNLLLGSQEGELEHEQLQKLFEAFKEKQRMLHMLDDCLLSDGVQLFIGEESGFDALKQCSVVTSRYTSEDGAVGVLGVIGPTRMQYERVIPLVDATAKLLSKALNRS